MRDDYLWDGSGEPDPEIQKLESVLGKLRHNRPAPAFPEVTRTAPQPARPRLWWLGLSPRLAAVAASVLAIAAIAFIFYWSRPVPDSGPGWDVTSVSGAPMVGSQTLPAIGGKLRRGQTLQT